MPLVFGVLVDVFLREAAEKDAVQAGVESVEVGAAHVTDARLGLEKWWETMGLGEERSGDLGGGFAEKSGGHRPLIYGLLAQTERAELPVVLIKFCRSVRHTITAQDM